MIDALLCQIRSHQASPPTAMDSFMNCTIPASWLVDNKLYGRNMMQNIGFMMCFILFIIPAFLLKYYESSAHIHSFQAMYFLSSFFNQSGPNCTTFLVAAEVFPLQSVALPMASLPLPESSVLWSSPLLDHTPPPSSNSILSPGSVWPVYCSLSFSCRTPPVLICANKNVAGRISAKVASMGTTALLSTADIFLSGSARWARASTTMLTLTIK
jgi:hypothetical protein